VTIAHIGDSKCITIPKSGDVWSTTDHSSKDKKEYSRVVSSGGFICRGRVNDILMITRALGDYSLKDNERRDPTEQVVIATPTITTVKMNDGDMLLLACDGLFDSDNLFKTPKERTKIDFTSKIDGPIEKRVADVASKIYEGQQIGRKDPALVASCLIGTSIRHPANYVHHFLLFSRSYPLVIHTHECTY
jgi:serine/threonine protein phosphatase PrpC